MTKWTELPLRPHAQPWPGLNTRGGRLDPGAGFLEDGSFNQTINEADILEKRLGFVRGLEERFEGPVCGLFPYTDICGNEYLLVADSTSIKIRQPFSIPEFLGTDSIPFDDFAELDTTRWSNTTDYEASMGSLTLVINASPLSPEYVPESRLMQWFKESVLSSYFVEIQYDLNNDSDLGQLACVTIKRNGITYLQADVLRRDTVYQVILADVQSGVRVELARADLGGATLATGFLRLSFNAASRVASARVIPSGGDQVTVQGTVSEFSALNYGQHSAIGLSYQTGANPTGLEVLQVSGGAL